jgi:hypothetical protein
MPIDPKCAAAVRAAAAGRKLSSDKLATLNEALDAAARDLARQDPPRWRALTRDQRMAEALQKASDDLHGEAALKEHRANLQLLRVADTDARIAEQMRIGKTTRSQAQIRDIANSNDYVHAVRDEAVSGLKDFMDAAESKDGTGAMRNLGMRIFDLDNPKMTADIVREIFKSADGHTGNAVAKAAARAWLDTIEAMRQRFNAAGGSVGKLGYGYLGQAHDMARIVKASADEWAAKVMPLLDRKQYLNSDGAFMKDVEVMALLRQAHETLATGGANKTEPGSFKGKGARANRGSQARVLHFKDGEAWMAYMHDFGEGSLYDAMMGHIGGMAREIGLTERYGPNPEQTFKLQADISQRADGKGTLANRAAFNAPQAFWDIATGVTGAPENRTLARVGSDLRNIQTAAKLGGAVLSSIADVGTIASSLHFNRLPYFQMLTNIGRRVKPGSEERDFLLAHDVIAESLTSTLNRWTGDNMTHSLTGRVSASVMKLSLMNAWTDGLRGAFAATMMQGFSKKLGKGWGDLDEWDQYLMGRKGITEADWSVITQAAPVEREGRQYLSPAEVRKVNAEGAQQAASKWAAFVSDEAQFAVLNPGMGTRAIATGGGLPAGTVRGEAMRSIAQFKSFPIAMIERHWGRIFQTPQGLEGAPMGYGATTKAGGYVNRVAGLAALNVSLMMLGAMTLQLKALITGKDPYDMTQGKFWARATAQGGGSGYVGDFLFKDPTTPAGGNNFGQAAGSAFGPVAGATASLALDLGLTNAWELAKGKPTHAGAEALRWTNDQLPYVGLWETRALWERAFLFQAQEALSPGYTGRMQQRAQHDWGQGYWWSPTEGAPHRAPDFAHAVGE